MKKDKFDPKKLVKNILVIMLACQGRGYEALWRPCPTKRQCHWCNLPKAKIWCSQVSAYLDNYKTVFHEPEHLLRSYNVCAIFILKEILHDIRFFRNKYWQYIVVTIVILPGRWWKLLWEGRPRDCRGRKSSIRYTWITLCILPIVGI